jgi:hypothetical protein
MTRTTAKEIGEHIEWVRSGLLATLVSFEPFFSMSVIYLTFLAESQMRRTLHE